MKNYFFIPIASFFILSHSIIIAQDISNITYVQPEQFKIANVTLGSLLKDVEKVFGKADSIEAVPSKLDSIEEQLYYFNGVTILASNDRVSRLECINPNYKTPKGIKVGDTISKLFKTYGKSEIWVIGNNKEVHYALWPPCDTYMIFELQDNKITKIILDYVP